MQYSKMISNKVFTGKFAVICGGSKGMGKAIASDFVKMGGSVYIIARNMNDLTSAQEEISPLRINEAQMVEIKSIDTTKYDKFQVFADELVKKHGVPDFLFNMVGYAHAQYFEKLTIEDFRRNMEINYYGQLVPILSFSNYFREAMRGHIINFSSVMGFLGFMGYTSYTPTKYALVGLTEALRHELKPFNIRFSVVYPPDTDTPGLHEENKLKPQECAEISEAGKLWSPEQVSESVLMAVYKKKYNILPGSARIFWLLSRFMPWIIRLVSDGDYKKIRKRMGKSK